MTMNPSLARKHAARIAAVQCLYQREFMPEESPDQLIVARMGMDGEEDSGSEEFEALPEKPDPKLLRALVTGAVQQQAEIDRRLTEVMAERWSGHRMPQIMRALFRAAAFELIYLPGTPARVVLSEYTTLASGFLDDAETGFINASLQELAGKWRE